MNFLARKEDLAMNEAGGETMIYDLLIDRAYVLNETSAFVWQMCDGEHDLAEISKALAEKTNQPVGEDLVKLAIEQLKANNLLADSESIKDFFTKTSRRKVIRQVGVATMIALPVIFSLTAPAAAHAASVRAACQPCTQNSQCASNKCSPNVILNQPKLCSNGTEADAYSRDALIYATSANCTARGRATCCTGAAVYNPVNGGGGCYCR